MMAAAAAPTEVTTAAVAPTGSGNLPAVPAGQPLSATYAGIQAAANARLQTGQAVASSLPRPAINLPTCPANRNLLMATPGGLFPKNWATLQPQVQSMHPINLAMMHLASVSNAEQASQISTCLDGWGAVAGSIQLLSAPVPGYNAGSNAVVFRTTSDIFISFR
jgi:endonuclease/exonuclease/phosphatase family metal-dependent hydrolase